MGKQVKNRHIDLTGSPYQVFGSEADTPAPLQG
jgi:hypothetical protein